MANFEIKNFFQFNGDGKVKAGFSLETAGGFYYDMKLVEGGANGHFIACAQQRSYDKKDGSGKGYINSFGTTPGTKASKFFNEVAVEAARLLKRTGTQNSTQSGNSGAQCTGENGCQCMVCTDIPF